MALSDEERPFPWETHLVPLPFIKAAYFGATGRDCDVTPARCFQALFAPTPAPAPARNELADGFCERLRAVVQFPSGLSPASLKCRNKKCPYTVKDLQVDSAQTRSSDEGQTLFFTCKCGTRWRV